MVVDMAPNITQVCNGGDGTVNCTKENTPSLVCKFTDHCVTPEMIQELLQHDDGKGSKDLVGVVTKFREALCCSLHPATPVCDTNNVHTIIQAEGCVAKFVELLNCNDEWILQRDAGMILANIAFEGEKEGQAVVSAGALHNLITNLESPQPEVQKFSAWALMNICGRTQASRKLLLDLNVIPKLLPMLEGTVECVQTAALTLRNLCRVEPSSVPFKQLAPCLSTLAALTTHRDTDVRLYACRGLLSAGSTYGSSLLTALTPAFINTIDQLPAKCSYESPAVNLTNMVKNMMPASCLPAQQMTSQGKQDQDDKLGKVSKGQQTPTKRSASPIPLGVSTRSTPKRMRVMRGRPSCPSWPRTRGRTRRPLLSVPGKYSPQLAHKVWAAVEAGDMDQLTQLVRVTGPTVTRGNSGCTLLHVAAVNNQPEVVEWLLQLLSPNMVNRVGLTPSHLAAMKGHTQVLRLLLNDPHLDHQAQDPAGNTYKHWLCVPLFEAVLEEDRELTRCLLRLGADPDLEAGSVVRGALVKELGVTTARQLASTLGHNHILALFNKTESGDTNHNQSNMSISFGSNTVTSSTTTVRNTSCNGNVYKGRGAYVTILSYSTFPGQPHLDLSTSHTAVDNLASTFTKLGYSGHIHKDLTQEQTRQVVARVRDMEVLDQVGCAIFVVVSHGTPNQHFLTSDGHLLDTQWLCGLFKDSMCPSLKNKAKLFMFDLCCGLYTQQQEEERGHGGRIEEPLRDTVCLYSNSGELTWYSDSSVGTPFSNSLCHTLSNHSHQELDEIYRHFLSHYSSTVSNATPRLCNVGFNKKFYFTSTPSNT
ncbi:hypothetical protein Pcinc_004435 [Petrolisthes cinctipes]|uniref:Caspase family p20 domain-containing protein n=1 Tax=Petrolisthes cinctipes TaxID=88211 RepID=A0AAE1L0A3_PETCI|nr:hypothetical protein Pcinc_004435 [Petrolisthes cinctipes]